MMSFVCCICYKSFDKWKSFSNHMHKCDNDDEEGGVDNNCDVGNANDVVVYESMDCTIAMTNTNDGENDDEIIVNPHNWECNSNELDDLEAVDHHDDICYNDFNTANVAESYDNIEVLLDMELESESEESDNNSHGSDISNMLVNEETEIEIINKISRNSLMNYKESKIADQSNLSTNMIAAIELLSLL